MVKLEAFFPIASLLFAPCAPAITVPLQSLSPVSVYSYPPNQQSAPVMASIILGGNKVAENAVRFVTESEVSYAVPRDSATFSGTLVYQPLRLELPSDQPVFYAPILVRITVDGKTLLEKDLDGITPPVEFTIPVADAQQVRVSSKAAFVGGTFYLARAEFGNRPERLQASFVPLTETGYVDCAPLPRQSVIGVFRPGESVAVATYFAGQASQANVFLRLTPEDKGSAAESRLSILLHPIRTGLVGGNDTWRVPGHYGPARLEINEEVAGRTVFQRALRVAVIPDIDVSRIPSLTFGIHLSTWGYPLLYDEFASLWGAKWARFFVRWPTVEPSPGHFDFSRLDALVDLYRNRGMRLLPALGEDAPEWAGTPGPRYYEEWKKYVAATVQHFANKVQYWDVFNEVDVKYNSTLGKVDGRADLEMLRSAMEIIHGIDPGSQTVCCSTGTTGWLQYDKRIFDAGLLRDIDSVSLHPYLGGAPEEKDGAFNYLELIGALRELVQSHGSSKPIWSTEANWILGPKGGANVTAPDLDERNQAEYVVRVNLLSFAAGVPYFLHAPFYHRLRPQPHLATLSAYATMTSFFSKECHTTMLANGPKIWGFSCNTSPERVGVVWSTKPGSTVNLSGAGNIHFFDMYGNPVSADPASLHLSSITYFVSSAAPRLEVVAQAPEEAWRPVPPLTQWSCASGTRCASGESAIRVESQPSKYGYQLVSPPIPVDAEGCQVARVKLKVDRGVVGFFAIDALGGRSLGKIAYVNSISPGVAQEVETRFQASSATAVKLVLANGNLQETASFFSIVDSPRIANCR